VWAFPAVLTTLVSFVLALAYSGGIIDPQGSTRHLPVALVDLDGGDLSRQFVHGIATAPDPVHRVSWKILSARQARDAFTSDDIYGAIEVPRGFTASLRSIATRGAMPARHPVPGPQVTLLTNPGAGSLASALATAIETKAVRSASGSIGAGLDARLRATGATPTEAQVILLADPIASTTRPGHPIGVRTGLGLTAFYFALLVVLSGFLGANIIHMGVDAALGYSASELGPIRRQRAMVRISRTGTLVIKMVMSAVLSVVSTSVIVLATDVILRMDMPHLLALWVFSVCASAVVGLGAQAVIAAFGSVGLVVSTIFFVALAIPSAGATVPLEAVPSFYRFLAWFEPLRQIGGGVRAIMYFDARADAGLRRAWALLGVGCAVALLFGFGTTRWYDLRGYERQGS
jgi:hypothetical protein